MKTIAIIDDDIHIGDALSKIMDAVASACSGTEALYLLSRCRPDLILLDLMLPGLPGEEVPPHLKGIPVIVLSAKVDVRDKVDLLLGGAADDISKPFDRSELLARTAGPLLCLDRRRSDPGHRHLQEILKRIHENEEKLRATLDEQENAILDAIKNDCLTVSSPTGERRFHRAFRLENMFCAGSYPVVFCRS